MKKIKNMALTGILLSSAILGANTTVIQAATTSDTSSNNPIKVDTSAITKVINVINDLLGSSKTANTVNPQVQFSDLVDGSTQTATPIFGKKTAGEFASALQSELNVVDSNGQLVPMTVTETDSNGFAKTVSYTLDGTTKTINVSYSLTKPTVSFNAGKVMNFNSNDSLDTVNSALATVVKGNTTNGTNANGTENTASVNFKKLSSVANSNVDFTPKDLYGDGITDSGVVNVYTVPEEVTDRTVSTADIANEPFVFESNGQKFSAQPDQKITDDSGESNAVTYTVTGLDSAGNTVVDASTNKTITGKATGNVTVKDGNYTFVFKDNNSQKTVLVSDVTPTADTDTVVAAANKALNGTGYELSSDPTGTLADQSSKEIDLTVTKPANTTINYIDLTTGKAVSGSSTESIKGSNGDTAILQNIPSGYRLDNYADLFQKLNDAVPSKNVYVTPIKSAVKNISYTVTFRDKDTGKVVGTSNDKGNLGDYIGLTAPKGYAFATIADHGFLLLKDGQEVTKYVTAANVPYKISYVDQDTNKEVGTESGEGADGSDVTLKAPDNYAFINADDMTYTIDKSDTSTKTVYVKKSNQAVDNIVAGYPKNGYIKIYDANGKLNDNVVLSQGSSWIIDQTKTINGAEYYRVATNEYVKASDVYNYVPLQSIVRTKSTNLTPVYNTKGQLVMDLALDTNTPWYTDRSATIKGSEMYRVATDQWVKASDVVLEKQFIKYADIYYQCIFLHFFVYDYIKE